MRLSVIYQCAAIIIASWMVLTTTAMASGKPGEDPTVTFHIETDSNDNPKLIFPFETGGKTRYFRRLPEISTRDIEAFRPFPGDDGANSYGIVFKLKNHAARRLNNITVANQGRMMLALAQGRPVDMVVIDKPVDNGFIVIWKGITEADIHLYDKAAPRIGEDKKRR